MKHARMAPVVLVLLAATAIGALGLLFMWVKVLWFAESLSQDVFECQNSAITSLQVGSYLPKISDTASMFKVDFNKLPFVCPIRRDNITGPDITKKLKAYEQKDFDKMGYKSTEKYQLDQIMWGHMRSCYEKMFYGQSPLFDREIFGIESEDTFCVVCSIIDFDEEVSDEFASKQSFQKMLAQKTLFRSDETLMNKSQDHPHVSTGFLFPYYETTSRQAVIYVRTNKPISSDISASALDGWISFWSDFNSAILDRYPFDIQGPARDLWTPTIEKTAEIKDAESVLIVPYENGTAIEEKCTILAAQLEVGA